MENSNVEKTQQTYRVNGMHCGGCANTVEQKLTALPGVDSAKVDLVKKQAVVVSDTTIKLSDLQRTLENTSYSIAEPDNNSSR